MRRLTGLVLAASVVACDSQRDTGRVSAANTTIAGTTTDARPLDGLPERLEIGRAATSAEIRAWDIDVNPTGRALPPGRGTAAQGEVLYRERCAVCHGAEGQGQGEFPGAAPRLIAREPRDSFPFGRDPKIPKGIGNYWPYATTIYDYIARAMPLDAPGSLTPEQVYSLTAYLLAGNGIIDRTLVIDARTLPKVVMPARNRFVPDNRLATSDFR